MLPYQIFLFILCLNTKTSFQVEYFFTGASGGPPGALTSPPLHQTAPMVSPRSFTDLADDFNLFRWERWSITLYTRARQQSHAQFRWVRCKTTGSRQHLIYVFPPFFNLQHYVSGRSSLFNLLSLLSDHISEIISDCQ